MTIPRVVLATMMTPTITMAVSPIVAVDIQNPHPIVATTIRLVVLVTMTIPTVIPILPAEKLQERAVIAVTTIPPKTLTIVVIPPAMTPMLVTGMMTMTSGSKSGSNMRSPILK